MRKEKKFSQESSLFLMWESSLTFAAVAVFQLLSHAVKYS